MASRLKPPVPLGAFLRTPLSGFPCIDFGTAIPAAVRIVGARSTAVTKASDVWPGVTPGPRIRRGTRIDSS